MFTTLLLAFVNIEPWMQFGLAGVTFITLATMFWRLFNKIDKRDKNQVDVDVMMKVREETLLEVNKRDAQILELSSKVLDGLHNSSRALDKMSERIEDLEDEVARCIDVREE